MKISFFKSKWNVPAIFGCVALAALMLPTLALAQSRDGQPVRAVPLASITGTATNLSPIVVTGQKLYLPVALQMIKSALKRPINFSNQNLNKLVCRFSEITGSHFKTLECETNCQIWESYEAIQGVGASDARCDSNNKLSAAGVSSPGVTGQTGHWGRVAATVVNWTNEHPVNEGAMRTLLKKLPPANSSYTFRLKDKGKVVAEYVFKQGNLVSVYKAKPLQ